jgi:SAM-dependent methyltransferase
MENKADKESLTIAHYEQHCEEFWTHTRDHDVSQNTHSFLDALPNKKPLDILDLGCGPGRDLYFFKSLGHNPTGLDGSVEFCKMAASYADCPVINETFVNMDLPINQFDGVFANASLFHVPRIELNNVLKKLHDCLRPNGILFTSNPRGHQEGWYGKRYGHYLELETSKVFLNQAGFEIMHHYYRPEGKHIDQQPWLAILSRKR